MIQQKEKLPLITVVLPIFNVEKYIEKCIDSVLMQTYPNLEVLLINDGSTDNTFSIIKKYGEHPACRIIDKDNTGQCDCRYIGLGQAAGDFIFFMDSDDFLVPDGLSKLYTSIIQHDADFVCCRYKIVNESGRTLKIDAPFKVEVVSGNSNVYHSRQIKDALWIKLFRVSFLKKHNICPDRRITLHDDCMFTELCLIHAERVSFVNEVLYLVLAHQNSISRKVKPLMMTITDVMYGIIRIELEKNGKFEAYQDKYYRVYAKSLIYSFVLAAYRCRNFMNYLKLYELLPSDSLYFTEEYKKKIRKYSAKYALLSGISRCPRLFFYLTKLSSPFFTH